MRHAADAPAQHRSQSSQALHFLPPPYANSLGPSVGLPFSRLSLSGKTGPRTGSGSADWSGNGSWNWPWKLETGPGSEGARPHSVLRTKEIHPYGVESTPPRLHGVPLRSHRAVSTDPLKKRSNNNVIMSQVPFFYYAPIPRYDPRKPPPSARTAHANSSSSSKNNSQTSHALAHTTSNPALPDGGQSAQDRMLSTPLPDYKHAANQTIKARAQAQRKSSSTSGTSSDRKNALQSAESRAAAVARGEQAGRSSSLSSGTGSSALTTVTSSDPPPTDVLLARPFSERNGRRYLRDLTLPYPLPCDLTELHRQTLRTMLLCQVFNGPLCSPAFLKKPPKRVLEVACGTGFWSVMCHRHFSQRGFSSISFTGIDIAPLAPRMDSDDDMNWRFVQHDLRRIPLPFRDEEFNLIMIKDLSMVTPTTGMQQHLMDEYLRILKPGGTLEIWDGDHSLRMLLPHAPPSTREDEDDSEDEEQVHTNAMGTYTLTPQTPLAAPQNQYLVDYNTWITKALESRQLTAMPCTMMRPMLLQEAENLVEIDNRRLAIPLGEVRWEREGVGGAVSQGTNGVSSHGISSKGKAKESDRKLLTAGQAALRRTALMTVVQMIESLEPLLRDASGKGQDEWDRWHGNMMNDLLKSNGTSWGECLEVGAWWARKKKTTPT